jgi:hypothetical protein
MKPWPRLPVLLLCVSVNAAQASHDLVFTFTTRQPIVQVSVNGAAAVPFVVDTGATIHLIDEEVARQARVAGASDLQMHGGGQAGVQAHIAESLDHEGRRPDVGSATRSDRSSRLPEEKALRRTARRADPEAVHRTLQLQRAHHVAARSD